jgi:hypothetical protein
MSQDTDASINDSLAPGAENLGVTSTAAVATRSSSGSTEAGVVPAASAFMPSTLDLTPVQGMRYPLIDEENDTVFEYVLGHFGWVRRRWGGGGGPMDVRLYFWYGDDQTTVAQVKTAPDETKESDLLSDVMAEAIPTSRLHPYQPREDLAADRPTGCERSVFGNVGQSDDGRRGTYLLVSRGGSCLLDGGALHQAIESVYDKAFKDSGEGDDDDYYDADEDRWEDSLTSVYRSYIDFLQGQGVAVTAHSPSRTLEPCDVFHYKVHKLQQRKDKADDDADFAERRQAEQLESMISGLDELSF